MNNIRFTNLNKLLKLKECTSMKLGDTNFYSTEFLKNIIFEIDKKTDYFSDPQVLIYGDFNGLADINTKYGRSNGTKYMHNSLSLIKSILPNDVDCFRIGGDEFLFVFPLSSSNKSPKLYKDEICNALENNPEANNLTMEISSYVSQEPHSLQSIFENLQNEVETNKKNHIVDNYEKKYNHDNWNVLRALTQDSFEKFFKTFRLPINYQIDKNRVIQRNQKLVKQFQNSWKSFQEEKNFNIPDKETENNTNIFDNFEIIKDQLISLFNLLTNKYQYSSLSDKLANLDPTLLDQLINSWTRNSLTQLFNRNYLENDLINNIDLTNDKYRAIYLSLSGIKLYNDTKGHSATDDEISSSASFIKPLLSRTLHKSFADTPFKNTKDDSYLIDLGGGDFFAIIKNDSTIKHHNIPFDFDNEHLKNDPLFKKLLPAIKFFNKRNNLPITCVTSNIPENIDKENFEIFLDDLKRKCDTEKVYIKKDLMDDPLSDELLNSIFCNLFSTYKNLINDPYSEESRNKFKDIIITSALNEVAKYTPFYKMHYYNEPNNENLSTLENAEKRHFKEKNIEASKQMQKKSNENNEHR